MRAPEAGRCVSLYMIMGVRLRSSFRRDYVGKYQSCVGKAIYKLTAALAKSVNVLSQRQQNQGHEEQRR